MRMAAKCSLTRRRTDADNPRTAVPHSGNEDAMTQHTPLPGLAPQRPRLACLGRAGLVLLAGLPAVWAHSVAPRATEAAPRVVAVALGTAQDGAVPQAGCDWSRCVAARRDPGRRRRVASLALQLAAGGRTRPVRCTPCLR